MSRTFWGRKATLAKLDGLLMKADPDNVSVVGPRGIGKTMLLRELARRYVGQGNFVTACYVDLKHRRHDLAHPVFGPLAEALKEALEALGDQDEFSIFAEDIDPASERVYATIRRLALDDLAGAKRSVLVILDGCDEVLKTALAPRAVWDGLRDLEQSRGVRFVTGSRRRLVELCRDDDASSSDFFELFKQRIDLKGFTGDEWGEIFAANGIEPAAGAEKECQNWTAGHPALAGALMAALHGVVRPGASDVNSAGTAMVVERHDAIVAIWQDVGSAARADLAIMAKMPLPAAVALGTRLDVLQAHGLVRKEGSTFVCASRALAMHAMEHGDTATDLQRLFGTPEAFKSNVRQVLEFRHAQLGTIDKDLSEYLRRSLGDVEHARFCLMAFRGLANRALDLVFQREVPGAQFPPSWVAQWKKQDNKRWPGNGFPAGDRGRQCQLLWEIVDDSRGPKLGQTITRRSVALIEQIKGYGDLGQHLDDSVDGTIAVAACFAALEMCESLTRDLR